MTKINVRPLFNRRAARLSLAAILALATLAVATPESSNAKEGKLKAGQRWTLDVQHSMLKTVAVRGRLAGRVSYHYMVFNITNNTGFKRPWHPLVSAVTDTGRTTIATGNTEALEPIRRQEADSKIVPIGTTNGSIKNGETINVVAIFGPLDPNYDRVDIQFFGLVNPVTVLRVNKYGDREIIDDPAYSERNAKVMKLIKKEAERSGNAVPEPVREYRESRETRFLNMTYERLGDEYHAEDDLIRFIRQRWLVAGEPKTVRVLKGRK